MRRSVSRSDNVITKWLIAGDIRRERELLSRYAESLRKNLKSSSTPVEYVRGQTLSVGCEKAGSRSRQYFSEVSLRSEVKCGGGPRGGVTRTRMSSARCYNINCFQRERTDSRGSKPENRWRDRGRQRSFPVSSAALYTEQYRLIIPVLPLVLFRWRYTPRFLSSLFSSVFFYRLQH